MLKNTNPLISILMPVKNTALFLPVTIKSILSQTEKNWELIAVNDNSTDNSYEILKKYSQEDSRIRIYENEEGKGIIPALKTALYKSRGKMITRMDSDDIMTPYKLEKMSKILKINGCGTVATGPVKCFSEDKLGDGYKKYENWLNSLIIEEKCYEEIFKECVIQSSCWMVYKEDLDKCNSFNENIYPEDYDLCFRFFKNNLKVKSHHELLHQWRDHPLRTSRNDPKYEDQQYFDLKLKYFFELKFDSRRPLIVWGTGKKGKKFVRKLQKKMKDLPFIWVGNNQKKIGEKVYDILIQDYRDITNYFDPQIIVAVSSPTAIPEIVDFLNDKGFVNNHHFYFFC
jgi:glycosyltransferase involved in cell wall biosynthesis